jgi:type II secretion system protein I
MKRNFPHSRNGGFTLLEILVALAIMSIALVVVFQLFSANMRGITASGDYIHASMLAESKMREILDDDKLAEKSSWSDVTEDGNKFDAVVTSVEDKRTENLPVKLLKIDVTVHWMKGSQERTITLETMKLVKKQL